MRDSVRKLTLAGGMPSAEQLALLEAQYVVARMAQTFASIEGHGDKDWVEHYALATSCRNGVHVSLRRAR